MGEPKAMRISSRAGLIFCRNLTIQLQLIVSQKRRRRYSIGKPLRFKGQPTPKGGTERSRNLIQEWRHLKSQPACLGCQSLSFYWRAISLTMTSEAASTDPIAPNVAEDTKVSNPKHDAFEQMGSGPPRHSP